MRSFRALVVDNDPAIRRLAEGAADPSRGIEVRTAPDLVQAEDLLASSFFNVAFVDLQLDDGPRPNVDGKTLLSELCEVRPACRRLLLTMYPEKYRGEVFALIDPERPIIDGAVDKEDFEHHFVEYLEREAISWLRAPVTVEGLDELFARLSAKDIVGESLLDEKRRAQVTIEEVDYVLSRLFGQDLAREGVDPDDIDHIALSPLEGGKSRSVVAVGRPVTVAGGQGIPCVIKVGPRGDTLEEQRRYDRYVRFRVSLRRRVELLSAVHGDTLGAVCYSFAGQSPDELTDLQSLFDSGDPRALVCLERLLGGADDWRPEGERGFDLAGFFSDAYQLDVRKIISEVHRFADKHDAALSGRKVKDELRFEGGKISLPSNADVGSGVLRGRFGASVVHGDLNASNVIVSSRDDVTLIDFRHTTRGPWCLDFAALQASVRLSADAVEQAAERAVQAEELERRLWAHDWSKPDGWWPKQAKREPPYWATAAARLMFLANRNLDGLTVEEHAGTTLLYALRVFRAPGLSRDARLRLLIWMSALCRVLAADHST
jgi:thiamine kinase-like enzyme